MCVFVSRYIHKYLIKLVIYEIENEYINGLTIVSIVKI